MKLMNELRGCFVQLKVTLKKPMRCPAVDEIEPALVFKIIMTHYYIREGMGIGQWSISWELNCREDEMISSLGKVTIRPREERIQDMNVKGRPFWVKVPTFHLKDKPQGLMGQFNHR